MGTQREKFERNKRGIEMGALNMGEVCEVRELKLHPLEIAPKKLLLLEYVHRKVVLPLG